MYYTPQTGSAYIKNIQVNMSYPGKVRNTGLDFLRILLAVMIIANHSIGHGISIIDNQLYIQNYNILSLLIVIANPAVNCFFIISGMFEIKQNKKMFKQLYVPVVVISFVVALIGTVLRNISIISALKMIIFPWMNWWFVAVYFLLWIFAPYINKLLDSITERELKKLVFLLIAVSTIQGCVLEGSYWGNGFSFSQAVLAYILGRYLRTVNVKYKLWMKVTALLSITAVIYIILLISHYLEIEALTRRVLSYANPLVILQASLVIIVFMEIHVTFMGKYIRHSNRAVFFAYLITDSVVARQYIYTPMVSVIQKYGMLILVVILNAIIIFLLCSALEGVYSYIEKRLVRD